MRVMTWRSGLAVASIVAAASIVTAGASVLGASRARDVAAVRRLRDRLEQLPDGAVDRFDPAMVADLPAPAKRYFLHTIRVGTPLARTVRLGMTGSMRLGPGQRWLPLRAEQVLAPPDGFVWEARVGRGLMRFAGADAYSNGHGRVAFRLWDVVPIVRAGGPDISRAARERLAIESVWQPASLLPGPGVTWTSIDDRTARVVVEIDGEEIPLTLAIAPDGRLASAATERWGNLTTDGRYAAIPFGVDVLGEHTFGGYTLPAGVRVGWWYRTGHPFEFFRADVVQATFLPFDASGASDDGTDHVLVTSLDA